MFSDGVRRIGRDTANVQSEPICCAQVDIVETSASEHYQLHTAVSEHF
jgi:hypothetical protein